MNTYNLKYKDGSLNVTCVKQSDCLAIFCKIEKMKPEDVPIGVDGDKMFLCKGKKSHWLVATITTIQS